MSSSGATARWSSRPLAELVPAEYPVCYGVLKPGLFEPGGVPLIRIVDLVDDQVAANGLFRITDTLDAAFKRSRLRGGEILLSIQGTIGRTAIVPLDLAGANISRTIARIDVGDRIDATFMRHWLLSTAGQRALEDTVTGTTRDSLNIGALRLIQIPVPTRSEQGRIAAILDSVDEAIAASTRLIVKLERIRKGLLHDILTWGIDDSGALRSRTYDGGQFNETPLGLRPRRWSLARLGNLANTFAGGTPSRSLPGMYDGDVPWVKSGELNQPSVFHTEESITQRALAASPVKLVPAGVPIIAMYGATAGVVSWLGIEATTNQAVLAIVPRERTTSPRWLYWELAFATGRLLAPIQGSGQPNLSKNTLDDTLVAVPEPEEQARIAEVADGLMRRTHDEQTLLVKLLRIKQGMTDDLLSGQVCVSGGDENAP